MSGGNIREFQIELTAMFDATMQEVREDLIELSLDAERLLKQGSPVVTGQFRSNWHISVGGPDALVQVGPGGELGAMSGEALATYPKDAWPVIVLQNNVAYAIKLEEGSSNQAPQGVVAVAIPAVQAIWDAKKR